jgi:hypothetical protein
VREYSGNLTMWTRQAEATLAYQVARLTAISAGIPFSRDNLRKSLAAGKSL